MNIIPLSNYVLIERAEKISKTEGGIILPEIAKERPKEGTVISVGEGKIHNGVLLKTRVKKGQKVIFSTFSGNDIDVEGKEYFIMSEEDILAILEEGEQV
jgi:chaperonin GroES